MHRFQQPGSVATFADLHVVVPRPETKAKILGRDMQLKHAITDYLANNCIKGMNILQICNQR